MSHYQQLRDNFDLVAPEYYNFSRDVIDRWAEDPQKLAILWIDDEGNERRVSFRQLSEASQRLCNLLSDAGVERGDTVMVVLGRELAWWETVTACLRMGAIVSPGTTQLSASDLEYRINACGAKAIVTDATNAAKVDAVGDNCPTLSRRLVVGDSRENWWHYDERVAAASSEFAAVDTAADEDALCYFTSGTTGYPKMVVHKQQYALGHWATGKYWLDLGPDDLHWNISDTGWAKAAWSSYFGPWLCGAALFVHHTAQFDPKRILQLFAQYPISTMCGAPTVYRMLVQQEPENFSYPALRHCVGAGEPLNPEVIERWQRATGLVIHDGFGQTETTLLCGNFPGVPPRFGSMGKPAPGIVLGIVDEQGGELLDGEEGDVGVRVSPKAPIGLFKEYKGQLEKTAACFRGDWYLTGDRAKRDSDGYFWFVSRADDVILSAGYRIGPFEVESALIKHPAVVESAVVSSPDVERGEVVKAFVVLHPSYEPSEQLVEELKTHVKAVTAPYKYPRKIEFLAQLPKTVSGKIRRVELREREWKQ